MGELCDQLDVRIIKSFEHYLLIFFYVIKFNQMVDYGMRKTIINPMVEYNDDKKLSELLSKLLKAVSDTTRRALLTQLCQQGPSRVTDLAKVHAMSLNAISKHIKLLEKVGLVTRKTIGRTHWIEADLKKVVIIEDWFKQLKSIWEIRLEKLDELINTGEQ